MTCEGNSKKARQLDRTTIHSLYYCHCHWWYRWYSRKYTHGRIVMHGCVLFTFFVICIKLSRRQHPVASRGATADCLHTQVLPGKFQQHPLACDHFTVEQQAKSTDGIEARQLHVMRDALDGENVCVSQASKTKHDHFHLGYELVYQPN
jgi:hypothetical protein